MKKVLYSALAAATAIAGVAATKATASNHRVSTYKYIPTTTYSQLAVQDVTNWTLVTTAPTCTNSQAACSFTSNQTTKHPSVGSITAIPGSLGTVAYVPQANTGAVLTPANKVK